MSKMKLKHNFQRLFLQVTLISFCVFPCNVLADACSGNNRRCCAGYEFNVTSGKCEECKVGYYDKNCTETCPFPSYGRECQNLCNCTKDKCNFITGCEEKTIGRTSMNTKQEKERRYKTTPLQYAIIGMSLLLAVITIAYVGVNVSQWRAKRTTSNV